MTSTAARGVQDTLPAVTDWPTLELAKQWYEPTPPGMGGPIKLTILTVKESVNKEITRAASRVLTYNRGAMEVQVAAMLMWLYCAPKSLVDALDQAGWFLVSLADWKGRFSDELDEMRRTVSTPRASPDPEGYKWMRKIFNITYRNRDDADWAGEYDKTNVHMPMRHLRELSHLTGLDYHTLFEQEAEKLLSRVIKQYAEAANTDTISDWWLARNAWMPGGSSSERHKLSDLQANDPRLAKQDRPDKKAVAEAMDLDDLLDRLVSPPSIEARASVKYEAAYKARALYATEDAHFHIASYASLDLEKFMNVDGMNARQTPSDVAEWVSTDKRVASGDGHMWYSLDYSDFNKEHRLWELKLINLILAKQWLLAALPKEVKYQKSYCAQWVAESYDVALVTRNQQSYRVWSGLFSGSRDTARDNTLLHCIYSNMVWRCLQAAGIPKKAMRARFMCGDDEDALFSSWGVLNLYAKLHSYIGWQLKPSKQMCGPTQHEYLQRTMLENTLPTRPICTILETLASGNWYSRPAIWYDSAISSVSDNAWEIHLRGMPLDIARRYAYCTLNAMMRLPDQSVKGKWRKLEWWDMRHSASKTPLWLDTGSGGHAPNIDIKTKIDPGSAAPSKASQDMVEHSWDILCDLDSRQISAYKVMKKENAYAKFYTTKRLRLLAESVYEQWPERYSGQKIVFPELKEIAHAMPHSEVIFTCAHYERERRPYTEAEVMSRMRLDPDAVTLAGGLRKVLRKVRPKKLSAYTRPVVPLKVSVPGYYLDSAVRSWVYQDGYIPGRLRKHGF